MSNAKTLAFLSCFGRTECDKPYFNNFNSVENSNNNKFLTTSLLAKVITLLKVKIHKFQFTTHKL